MSVVAVLPETEVRQPIVGANGYLTVNLSALSRNYAKLSTLVAPAQAAAVVKADAYDLGAQRVCSALYGAGCRRFFVAQFDEAVKLRPGLAADANGLQPGDEEACARFDIIPVLNSLEQWRRWSGTANRRKCNLPAALQFDTGMSRLGVPPEERSTFAAELAGQARVEILFIMSHLASADELDSAQNNDQLVEMKRISKEFPHLDICFANSGGIVLGRDYHGQLARAGIALYGGSPSTSKPNPMEPVVEPDVAVVQTRKVPVGARVGYSGTHIAERDARLATIAAGYADGLPTWPNTCVWLRKRRSDRLHLCFASKIPMT
ncbi:alanine racemase (plasmid) [Rhizobium leguminosarum]